MNKITDQQAADAEKQVKKLESMIQSMTPQVRCRAPPPWARPRRCRRDLFDARSAATWQRSRASTEASEEVHTSPDRRRLLGRAPFVKL